MNQNSIPDLDTFVAAALGRKAEDLVVLDMTDLTSIADAFIICSGRSSRQVSAIADHVQRDLKSKGIRALSVEGKGRDAGHWILIDYGHVIVHVFYSETRQFYDLEGLWSDAKRITTKSMQDQPKGSADPFDGEEITVD